jgi:hypothetical protein
MASREVEDAVGEAPPRTKLEQEAAALRRIVSEPSEKEKAAARLAEIERQIATQTEDEGRQAARERIVDINRAVGSLADLYQTKDAKKVVEAFRAAAAALEIFVARWRQVERFGAESAALADRFGVDAANIPMLVPPGRLEEVLRAYRALTDIDTPDVASLDYTPFESDEYGLRKRRTYGEIVGTPGYEVIQRAGLKPFRQLTPGEQRAVDATKDGATVSGIEEVERQRQIIEAIPPGMSRQQAGVRNG